MAFLLIALLAGADHIFPAALAAVVNRANVVNGQFGSAQPFFTILALVLIAVKNIVSGKFNLIKVCQRLFEIVESNDTRNFKVLGN